MTLGLRKCQNKSSYERRAWLTKSSQELQRVPPDGNTTPRKLGLMLINPEHIYRHDSTALCSRSDAIIILTFQMQKTAAQKVWWPRLPHQVSATAAKLSPLNPCSRVSSGNSRNGGGRGSSSAAPTTWLGFALGTVCVSTHETLTTALGGRQAGLSVDHQPPLSPHCPSHMPCCHPPQIKMGTPKPSCSPYPNKKLVLKC